MSPAGRGGATASAAKFGYSKQRYFQLLKAFQEKGAMALKSAKRGYGRKIRLDSLNVFYLRGL